MNIPTEKNIIWHEASLNKSLRAKIKNQKPCIIWFTGLSGSGKSTLANALEHELFMSGHHTYLLDGDNIRLGLNKDLGFSNHDREENIRRIGEVAKLMLDAGLIVLTAFISPFIKDRNTVRQLVQENEFIEVFVNTPLVVCEERDTKGLYKKARKGEIKGFTGIDSPYEAPMSAELEIRTTEEDLNFSIQRIICYISKLK
ncbi:MAG: adenylyl-sulfate kinase [Leptospiraceae bacterium]|nr:adenylyl-sulfate kinase [Leptospiraceae bacterium]